MSHYHHDERYCRVDFFKESGKWYTAESVFFGDMEYGEGELDIDFFRRVLHRHLTENGTGDLRLAGMTAVCLDPYVKYKCPLMTKIVPR